MLESAAIILFMLSRQFRKQYSTNDERWCLPYGLLVFAALMTWMIECNQECDRLMSILYPHFARLLEEMHYATECFPDPLDRTAALMVDGELPANQITSERTDDLLGMPNSLLALITQSLKTNDSFHSITAYGHEYTLCTTGTGSSSENGTHSSAILELNPNDAHAWSICDGSGEHTEYLQLTALSVGATGLSATDLVNFFITTLNKALNESHINDHFKDHFYSFLSTGLIGSSVIHALRTLYAYTQTTKSESRQDEGTPLMPNEEDGNSNSLWQRMCTQRLLRCCTNRKPMKQHTADGLELQHNPVYHL